MLTAGTVGLIFPPAFVIGIGMFAGGLLLLYIAFHLA